MSIVKEKFVAEYDFSDYLHNQIDYFKEDKQEFLVSILWDEERKPESVTDKEIEDHFYSDYYLSEIHFEDFTYMLEEEFTQHIGKEVRVEGTNMGWRNLNGHKEFTINKPIDVFSEIAPKCDLTFRIEGLGKNKYAIRIAHHDSPMGEYYELIIKE
tara:strand:- start:175 stop:642 length:468 start_codon:yes stop_codon:yes gene_type:complete